MLQRGLTIRQGPYVALFEVHTRQIAKRIANRACLVLALIVIHGLKESILTKPLLVAAKSRAIAIPVDLDSQVNNLFLKSHNIVQKTAMNWRMTARNAARRDSVLAASRDYRNIIERLQVTMQHPISL